VQKTRLESKAVMMVFSVALTSFLLLALQIVLMQAVGYAQGHHLAYVMVSVALLGFGAGGSVLTLRRVRSRSSLESLFAPALLLCALSTAWLPVPLYALLSGLELDLLFVGYRPWLLLSGLGFIMLLPFFFGAAAISIVFSTRTERIGLLYAANLLGSAAGAGAVLLALRWRLPEQMMPLLALLAWLAAVPFCSRKTVPALAAAGILAALFFRPDLPLSPYKALSSALQLPGICRTGPRPHPLGRVDRAESPALRYAPDLSLRYRGPVPSPPHLFIDGESAGVLLAQDDPAARILEQTPRALPFSAGPVESALFLSPDGTPYLHLAHAQGVRMTLVEPHPRIAEWIRPWLPPDSVQLVCSDPRRFLSQPVLLPYDLIVFPVRGLFGGPTGLQTLGEDALFTLDAVRRAFVHLTPAGRIAFNVWLDEPLRHALRITDLAVAGLREQGVKQPADHIVIVRGWGSMSLLAGRQPFPAEALMQIESFANRKGFDLLWPPGRTVRRHGSAGDATAQMLAALTGPDAESFRRSYRFDIRAPTDNRPFFNQFLRPADRGADLDFLSVSERGLLILQVLLYMLAAAVLLLVFGPLLPLRIPPLREPFTLLYFSGLGAGFMLFEVALIQRLIPLWGGTLTSAALVISALLCGMGIGSGVSRRIPARPLVASALALGVAGGSALMLQGLDAATGWLMPASVAGRGAGAFLLLMLPAIPMGLLFPLGLRLLAGRDARQIPWACGIDGAVAVLAAPSAALLAFQVGYSALTLAAAGAYLLAAAAGLFAVRPE